MNKEQRTENREQKTAFSVLCSFFSGLCPRVAGCRNCSVLFSLFSFLCLSAGCQNCHQVERELRDREREVRELREELDGHRALTMGLQHELCEIRQGRPPLPQPGPALPQAPPPYPAPPPAPPPEPLPLPTAKPAALERHAVPIETAVPVNTIKEIVLGRQTGGYDQSCGHGDDALQVAL